MRAFAVAALLALAGCSQGGDETNNQSSLKAGHREAQIGPLALEYDATKVVIAPVTVQLPPDNEREVRGMKLIAKSREAAIDTVACPDQPASICRAEAEGGLTLTMLNQPLAAFSAAIRRTRPATVAGLEGVTWEGRFGGKPATYTALPVAQQTLMMIRQTGGESAPDAATLDAVVTSFRFDEPAAPAGKGK